MTPSAYCYMQNFPYYNRLWYGESFGYDAKPGKALIALATWSGKEESVRLAIDFKALGIDPAKATLTAMPMDKLQEKAVYQISAALTIPPNKGLLLTLQQ